MGLEIKNCKYCGKLEEMAEGCDACLLCRVKKYQSKEINTARKYYLAHRKDILEKAKIRREKRIQQEIDSGRQHVLHQERRKARAKWTVEYIKTAEGYSWRAWFRNPATDRLVKFESARVFLDILAAQRDYTNATR